MADIKISRRKLLSTINKEFQEKYPYLCLKFYTPEQWKKARNEAETITSIPGNKRIADLIPEPPDKDKRELSIRGNTLVKTLEDNFLKIYGLHVQVTFKKGAEAYYTGGELDSMNLANLNKKLEAEGYMRNPPY